MKSHFCVNLNQAITITEFVAMSTGTSCGTVFTSASIVLKTPVPQAVRIPMGPFKVSTQPGVGSYKLGITEISLIVTTIQTIESN